MLIGSAAMWSLLCLEILHFDWLVNWLGNLVIEGNIGGVYWGGGVHIHTHTRQTR